MTDDSDPVPRPGAGRPTRAQAVARQNELLRIALDLFLDNGFEQTTVDAIAAAVGMTKRTIYARYADKAALFLASVERAIDLATVPAEDYIAIQQGDLQRLLTQFARMRIAHFQTDAGLRLQRIVNTESFRFPEIFNQYYEQAAGPAIAYLTEQLARAEHDGVITLGDPALAANTFMSMVVSGPVRIIVSGNPLTQNEIDHRVAFAVRLFMNGARPR